MAGISRSVTITAAYLMHKYEYSLNNVMELLSRRRKQVKDIYIEGLPKSRFSKTIGNSRANYHPK
jgi:protein-tyrosine phosphatase